MQPLLEVFSQGEEIITGLTVDSNAAWLSQQAVALGFRVSRHTAVGDNLADLVGLLGEIAKRADCCICSGGLGPTSDDLTAEAVAQAFASPLQLDLVALEQIEQFYRVRNRPMPAVNRKQAYLPQGAERLDNAWGTAPGFSLQAGRCWFAFVPGVPYEMRQLFEQRILAGLFKRFELRPKQLVTLKTIGLGESDLQQRIGNIAIPDEVQLGFCAREDEVQTKLLFPAEYNVTAMQALATAAQQQIGDYVYAVTGLGDSAESVVDVIDKLMQTNNVQLTVLESASQGLIAAKCLGMAWLQAAFYQQSIALLAQSFAINLEASDLLATAKQLALAVQAKNTQHWVLVQLYDGGYEQFSNKDCATILYNVLLTDTGFHTRTASVAGAAKRKQNQAAILALDLLRRYLQNKET
ncbi:MAG: molybdopterin-binding protein [Methylococcaceae bacterium]|jgi:competence/damage-inducible protein CinA-like protein